MQLLLVIVFIIALISRKSTVIVKSKNNELNPVMFPSRFLSILYRLILSYVQLVDACFPQWGFSLELSKHYIQGDEFETVQRRISAAPDSV